MKRLAPVLVFMCLFVSGYAAAACGTTEPATGHRSESGTGLASTLEDGQVISVYGVSTGSYTVTGLTGSLPLSTDPLRTTNGG